MITMFWYLPYGAKAATAANFVATTNIEEAMMRSNFCVLTNDAYNAMKEKESK